MSVEIDVHKLIRETTPHSPSEGHVTYPFLRRPGLSVSFSKDRMNIGVGEKVYCHLSINRPTHLPPNLQPILEKFKTVLGEPVHEFHTRPDRILEGKIPPSTTHHYLWESP